MNIKARAAEPFFRVNHVTLADAWGLTRIDTAAFFQQVSHRLAWYRASLIAAGEEASVMNIIRLHLECLTEDDPVDQGVLAVLNFVTVEPGPAGPSGGGVPLLTVAA